MSLFTYCLSLTSCGFHLRGSETLAWPASLDRLRVIIAGSSLEYDPLRTALISALRVQTTAEVVEQPPAAVLTLRDEQFTAETLSVRATTARVSELLLKYELSYRLDDGKGTELMELQTVRLRRSLTFDSNRVLGKDQEQAELHREMREDAVQHILRRLARVKP